MTVRMSKVRREKVSLDSRRVYCRRSSNRVCFLHVTVGCGVGYGHFWWTFLCKQEWVIKMGISRSFSEEFDTPIRESWDKITTFSENPKWGLPYVGLWKIVCNAPLLLYNTLIISEEVEIPNRQSWDKITTFFRKSEMRRIAWKTPLFDFTQPSSFQRRLKFPTDLECK